ncbi:MAG: hypothetical protein ACXWU2_00770 [Allosphingosinicella sp.]
MQEWIVVKESVATWTGLDHDALQLLAALPLSLGAALVLRRPLSHFAPWLTVLFVGIANEAVSGFADGAFEAAELGQSQQDLLLLMALPSVLFLIARYFPAMLTRKTTDSGIVVPLSQNWRRHAIVDAEYEEIR